MGIGKVARSVEYRMDKKFKNLLIFKTSVVFEIEKFYKFVNFPI